MDNDNKIESMNETNEVPENQNSMLIQNNRHDEVLLFLDEELKKLQEDNSSKFYNLEQEFSKTKKNKNWFTHLILLISVLFIVGFSFGLHLIVQNQNEKITVNLDEFADLNLKGLLDNVSKVQTQYNEAVKNKVTLEGNLETALKDADYQMENDIYLLDSLKLRSQKEYNNRRAEIVKNHTLRVKNIHDEYDSQIAIVTKEVETYRADLEKFDSQKVESAKAQEKALNSERRIRELEQKRLTEKYEKQIAELEKTIADMRSRNSDDMHTFVDELIKKYESELAMLDASLDPVISDTKASDIISSTYIVQETPETESEELDEEADGEESDEESEEETDEESEEDYEEEKDESEEGVPENENEPSEAFAQLLQKPEFDINKFLEDNSIDDERMIAALNQYQTFYDNYKYLDSAILDLPHKNSIPEYVSASRVLVNEMGQALAESSADLFKENEGLNKQVKSLNNDLKKQKSLLETEKKNHMADNEKYQVQIEEKQAEIANVSLLLDYAMTASKTNAVIISAEDADNIRVYVAPKVRTYITSEGVPAEFKIGRTTVKGKLVRRTEKVATEETQEETAAESEEIDSSDEAEFYFVPGTNKDGSLIVLDVSLITLGSAIKTTLK